jgi:hypothetical protein
MRDGLDAPTLQLSADDVRAMRAFLDGQSLITLLVWVRHEQQGVDGPLFDHHLMFGIPDDVCPTCDLWALEENLPLPPLQFGEPTWNDIFPLSEVEELRSFGTVVWEHDAARSTGDDPLDYRFTWEPLEVASDTAQALTAGLSGEAGIARVDAARRRLWKNGVEVGSSIDLYVDASDEARLAVTIVQQAATQSGLVGTAGFSVGRGLPRHDRIRTATVYQAAS